MRRKMRRANSRLNKSFVLVVMGIMLFSLSAGLIYPNPANAVCGNVGVPSDTLTIKVGYFGDSYYTKKVYTLSDFDKLPQVQQAYTSIDNLPAICIDAAAGVKLRDLLIDAGIDINSIQKFYFYSTDIKKGWYQCLDKADLLDTPRYYYPNLPSHWDYDTQSPMDGALDGAVQVDTIIAYKDNWQRYDDTPDFDNFDTSTRFRLLFGQKDTTEHNAPQSAKWVHSIEIMLGGMPPSQVSLDQDMVNLKVGSTVKLTATVAPDEATDKSVKWISSNPDVATVDENGLVTVLGEGMAVITVSTIVGELTASCIVNGPDQSLVSQNNASVGSGDSQNNEIQTDNGETAAATAFNSQQHLIDRELAEETISPEDSGEQPWRVFEMSADAVPLQRQENENNLDTYAGILFLLLFIFGSGRRYMEYAREVAM